MKISPKYSVTSEMLELIAKIEAIKIYLESLNIGRSIKSRIQRVSLLKSSLFSARIEGNTLNLDDLSSKQKNVEKEKQEVFNIIDAVKLIESTKLDAVSKDFLLKLHAATLKNISPDTGTFRKEQGAIFNTAGVAVYVSPPPAQITKLLDSLLNFVNSDSEKFPLIKALMAHLIFEKIHPFLDGNGRVGRLLIGAVLKKDKWKLNFIVPFEEYLDDHREEYYYNLDRGLEQPNDYLKFMLETFLKKLENLKEQIENEISKKEPFLPPRQAEIYNLILDHKILSFESFRRRFQKVPERTLRYDLKKLVEKGLIETTGETRGRYYRIKDL